jgi:hypothetical protein
VERVRGARGVGIIVTLVAAFASSALGCTIVPERKSVGRQFDILLINGVQPVAGVRLLLSRFRAEHLSSTATAGEVEQQVKEGKLSETLATALTDDKGIAHFYVERDGIFDLTTEHRATANVWIQVDVSSSNEKTTLTLSWPSISVLRTRALEGRIFKGLYSSKAEPLAGARLSLRSAISFEELETTVVDPQGKFRFSRTIPGLYFLRVQEPELRDWEENTGILRGDIAVRLRNDVPARSLDIAVAYSSCGLSYNMSANKYKYKPEGCFKGGKEIPCDY